MAGGAIESTATSSITLNEEDGKRNEKGSVNSVAVGPFAGELFESRIVNNPSDFGTNPSYRTETVKNRVASRLTSTSVRALPSFDAKTRTCGSPDPVVTATPRNRGVSIGKTRYVELGVFVPL